MKSALTKRVLDMLEKLAKNDTDNYLEFWKEFGEVLKEGPAEDFSNKEKVAGLFRFASSKDDSAEQTVGLADYVSRMQEGQDKIYYIVAENHATAKSSPHLEIFRKKGIEVLLLSDRIDEWMMGYLTEFDGKSLQDVSKGSLDLGDLDSDEDKKEKEKVEKEFEDFVKRFKDAKCAS